MKKRILTAVVLSLLLLVLGLDIIFASIDPGRRRLPVLMYHHFDQESSADTVVSAGVFREQMEALKAAGFTAVTLKQIQAFVEEGQPLPKKPVLITMDDGYTSNLTLAAPILEDLGMCATVFVIGINEGETTYIHSGEPLMPSRFSYEEAAPWVKKGVLDLQSHSYDLHQLASYGYSDRDGMRPLAGESLADYQRVLSEDMAQFRRRREGRVATDLVALAYPFGYWTEEADVILQEEGIPVTFTIDPHCNLLIRGDTSSLRLLGRYNVTDRWSGQALVRLLERAR